MSKLESMNILANKEAKKLGIETPLAVVWHTQCPTNARFPYYRTAHAHCYPEESVYGTICVRWGLKPWKETVKHEVAHFVLKGSGHNSLPFLEARARQGDRVAANELVRRGKKRCPRHVWVRGKVLEEKTTSKGLLVLYEAHCMNCRRGIGGWS